MLTWEILEVCNSSLGPWWEWTAKEKTLSCWHRPSAGSPRECERSADAFWDDTPCTWFQFPLPEHPQRDSSLCQGKSISFWYHWKVFFLCLAHSWGLNLHPWPISCKSRKNPHLKNPALPQLGHFQRSNNQMKKPHDQHEKSCQQLQPLQTHRQDPWQ